MVRQFSSITNAVNIDELFTLSGAVPTFSASFGQGQGPILLNNVQCVGYETRLVDCLSGLVYRCYHYEDAGVRCNVRTGKMIVKMVAVCILRT